MSPASPTATSTSSLRHQTTPSSSSRSHPRSRCTHRTTTTASRRGVSCVTTDCTTGGSCIRSRAGHTDQTTNRVRRVWTIEPGDTMSGLIKHILALHGAVAVAVIFLMPALESSAFVGFVFPGEIAVLLGGVLAFQHRVPLAAAIAAAVAGAIIGDTVGYAIGRRWGRKMIHGSLGRLVK